MKKTRTLVITSLLIAFAVIFARFLAVKTDLVRISLEFAPIALSAVLSGPLFGAVTGMIADLIGATLFPSGTFFPGFTLSAFITGIIYGLFLHKKRITFLRTTITVFIKVFLVDMMMVTTWLMILYQMPLEALITARLIKCAIMIPIEIVIIFFVIRPIKKHYVEVNKT